MSGNRVLEYWIKAKDATAGAISSAIGRMKTFAATVGKNLTNIKSGFEMLAGTARAAFAQMQKAFAFEKMTIQFKTLTGSMDEARAHMQMLQDMGDTPPFSMEQYAAASRQLMVMSDGALGYKDTLNLVGDAAAATGNSLEGLSHEIGRAYAIIRDGQPLTRATMGLRNMGVITPEVAAKLDEMQKAGYSNAQMWDYLTEHIGRFKGAMTETESTGDGLMGAIGAQWDDAVRSFGEAFLETSKTGMGSLLDAMKTLNEDGTVEEWAERTSDALSTVKDSLTYVVELFGKIGGGIWKGIKSTVGVAMAFGAGADQAYGEGQGFLDQIKNGAAVAGQYWNDTWNPQEDTTEQDRADRRSELAEKKKKAREERRAKADQMAAEKQAKMKEELARKQEEKEQKEAEAAYEEELKKYYEMLDKEEEARRKMEEQLAEEARRAEEKRHEQKMKDADAEVSALQSDRSEAENRLAAAQQKTEQAWGWYRNKDTMQAKIDDFKAQQAAEKQWAKDFEKLKSRRRDWRDVEFGQLSAADEATRQVALAKEEEQAAQKALEEIVQQETEANENLAAILAELKGGEG